MVKAFSCQSVNPGCSLQLIIIINCNKQYNVACKQNRILESVERYASVVELGYDRKLVEERRNLAVAVFSDDKVPVVFGEQNSHSTSVAIKACTDKEECDIDSMNTVIEFSQEIRQLINKTQGKTQGTYTLFLLIF